MKIDIKTNIKEVTKDLSRTQKKQIPFATAMAINSTLGIGRGNTGKKLDKVLGQQMKAKLDKPRPQTTKAFYRQGATKSKLTGVLGFVDWAAKFMHFQIEGGQRSSGKSGKIGVPIKGNANLNAFGNIPGLKNSGYVKGKKQEILTIGKTTGVWEKHKGKVEKLMVVFKNSVNYSPKFPFYKIANGYIDNNFSKNLIKELNKALRSPK